MMKTTTRARAVLLASALVLCAPLVAGAADSPTAPGFNLFSVDQDIEIGRQSAVQAERQLSLLKDRNVDRYLNRIIAKLAAQAPGGRYPYTVKAVNDPAINAFSLPGGPMYVNRGLLEAARSEAELAGVLAHEMAHVALRHGTHQASKAYLGQAGVGILGGLLGKGGGNTSNIVNAVGGLGMNVAFLKFGRDAEYQADQLGAQIMAGAGYSPLAMADFFALLRTEQGRDPGKVEQFFSDHPPSADREARIRDQAEGLMPVRSQDVGGFDGIRADARRRSPVSTAAAQRREEVRKQDRRNQDRGPFDVRVEPPSSRFQRFEPRSAFFSIEHPDNWRAYASGSGDAVSFAPDGGVIDTRNGQQAMVYGVIVNHYAPFEGYTDRQQRSRERPYAPFEETDRWRGSLEDATDDLVRQIIRSNSYLRAEDGQARREQIDGGSSFSVVLFGRSPVTDQEERVTVVTRGLSDGHVIYALCIVPSRGYDSMARTFTQMLRTLNINEDAAHRATRTSSSSDPRRTE
jgi:Zn-dependent protease with chaperone function